MSIDVGSRGDLARVRWVSADKRHLILDYRNGQSATVDSPQPIDVERGTVLLVRAEFDEFEPVEEDVWPEPTEVAVVRLRTEETTLIDTGGRLRLIATTEDVEYQEGNTVEVKESSGVVRVISPEPVRF